MKTCIKCIVLCLTGLLCLTGCKKGPKGESPTVTLLENETVVVHTKAQVYANILSTGGLDVMAKGFVYGVDGSFQDTVYCEDDDAFTSDIVGLLENTVYSYKAFAQNTVGTGWSEESTFTTSENSLPVVETADIIHVDIHSAHADGSILDDGGLPIIDCGMCWSLNPEPTIDGSHMSCEPSKDSFTYHIKNLNQGSTYFVRAYAVNSLGIAYGEEKRFVTKWPNTITFTVNDVTFKLIRVVGGTFYMGAQADDPNGLNYDENAYIDEGPVHQVTLDGYYVAETEVTNELWQAVMGQTPSYWSWYSNPVADVSWDDIVDRFLPRLNALSGKNFRLPTEAEWEFAARGGNNSKDYKFSGSNNVNEVALFIENSRKRTGIAFSRIPNELQLYGMSGNVWEWCSDWYGEYESEPLVNPQGPATGRYRVLRGGSCLTLERFCRVAGRNMNTSQYKNYACGFRIVLSQKDL